MSPRHSVVVHVLIAALALVAPGVVDVASATARTWTGTITYSEHQDYRPDPATTYRADYVAKWVLRRQAADGSATTPWDGHRQDVDWDFSFDGTAMQTVSEDCGQGDGSRADYQTTWRGAASGSGTTTPGYPRLRVFAYPEQTAEPGPHYRIDITNNLATDGTSSYVRNCTHDAGENPYRFGIQPRDDGFTGPWTTGQTRIVGSRSGANDAGTTWTYRWDLTLSDDAPTGNGGSPNGGSPPPDGDEDHDGRPNSQDNCYDKPNPDQSDKDHDGLGDVCDPHPLRPEVPDLDGDGVPDAKDNCQSEPNPGQLDSDHDLVGDACDEDDPGAPPASGCKAAQSSAQYLAKVAGAAVIQFGADVNWCYDPARKLVRVDKGSPNVVSDGEYVDGTISALRQVLSSMFFIGFREDPDAPPLTRVVSQSDGSKEVSIDGRYQVCGSLGGYASWAGRLPASVRGRLSGAILKLIERLPWNRIPARIRAKVLGVVLANPEAGKYVTSFLDAIQDRLKVSTNPCVIAWAPTVQIRIFPDGHDEVLYDAATDGFLLKGERTGLISAHNRQLRVRRRARSVTVRLVNTTASPLEISTAVASASATALRGTQKLAPGKGLKVRRALTSGERRKLRRRGKVALRLPVSVTATTRHGKVTVRQTVRVLARAR